MPRVPRYYKQTNKAKEAPDFVPTLIFIIVLLAVLAA